MEPYMQQRILSATTAISLIALAISCTSKASAPLTPTPPTVSNSDGSTLKASAPTPQSPINDVRLETFNAPELRAGGSTPTHADSATLQYEFELFNEAGTRIEGPVVRTSPSWVPSVLMDFDKKYSWRVRAIADGAAGPWSPVASFLTPNGGFIRGQELFDPLTNGRTVGVQHGGTFLPGQGWQSLSLTDGIDYDLPQTCSDNCKLEFDVTNFGPMEGQFFSADLKWVSMADAGDFGGFTAFRNSPWKMHLVQRGDYPTGIEIVWRNGGAGEDSDPGDHRIKLIQTPIVFKGSNVYHFDLEWATTGYRIFINGREIMEDGWDNPYAPPRHRISLGCYPRAESFIGAIYSNIKLTKTK
jgi:hypothetical protein